MDTHKTMREGENTDNHPAIVSHRKASELLSSRGYKRGEMRLLPNGNVFAIIDGNTAYNYTKWKILHYEDVMSQYRALDMWQWFKAVCTEIDLRKAAEIP